MMIAESRDYDEVEGLRLSNISILNIKISRPFMGLRDEMSVCPEERASCVAHTAHFVRFATAVDALRSRDSLGNMMLKPL